MNLSSNSLFHYTNSLDTLIAILKSGFKISYCEEGYMAYPMVSFNDIPLSQAKLFFDKYGSYALGMNENFSNKYKLNPVIYMRNGSILDKRNQDSKASIVKFIKEYFTKGKSIDPNFDTIYKYILDQQRFIKPYRDQLIRDGKIVDPNYKFYDEREWRYVHDVRSSEISPALTKEEYSEFKKTKPHKPHFDINSLIFDISDINYIILNEESEVELVIESLKSSPKFANNTNLLLPKILFKKQILDDF
jgi:hypothetical protein